MLKKQTAKKRTTAKSHIKRHVKLVLFPHKANQFRPHALRRYGIAMIVVFVLLLQASYNGMTSGNVLGTQAEVTPGGLLSATNKEREQQGEPALTLNADLSKAAELKVKNMFAEQYWAHNAPDGTTPWHWFGVVGYVYSEAGENLAKNFTTSDSAVSAWMASPTHRANILKAVYKDVGFAVMDGNLDGHPTSIVVALYGTKEAVVAGATVSTQAPISGALNLWARFGIGALSLSPAATASLIVLLSAAGLALIAHFYRKQLPSHLRRSWYRHHGVYKAIGFTALAVVTIFMYGGAGQI